jgi:hypothetical protein
VTARKEPARRLAVRAVIRTVIFVDIPFVFAGRFIWPRGWFFWAVVLSTLGGCNLAVRRKNPGLFRARMPSFREG